MTDRRVAQEDPVLRGDRAVEAEQPGLDGSLMGR